MKKSVWLMAGVFVVAALTLATPKVSSQPISVGISQSSDVGILSVYPKVLRNGNLCVYGLGLKKNLIYVYVGDQMLSTMAWHTKCPLSGSPNPGLPYEVVSVQLTSNQLRLLAPGSYHRVLVVADENVYGYLPSVGDIASSQEIIRAPTVMTALRADNNSEYGSRRRSILDGQVIVAVNPIAVSPSDDPRALNMALTKKLTDLGFNGAVATTLKIGNSGRPIVPGFPGLCGQVLAVLKAVNGRTTEDVLNEIERFRQVSTGARNTIFGADPVPHTLGPGYSARAAEFAANVSWSRTAQTYAGVSVAVLDTGVSAHDALTPLPGQVFTGPDFETDTLPNVPQPTTKSEDQAVAYRPNPYVGQRVGHGTAIASLIAGNSGDFVGIAPGVGIVPIKVCREDGTCTGLPVVSGICHAISAGVRVMNVSMSSLADNSFIVAALRAAAAAGITIVVSAGNRGCNALASFPALYATTKIQSISSRRFTFRILAREGIPGLISVSAVETTPPPTSKVADALSPQNVKATPFSSCGDWVTVAAPGVSVRAARAGTTSEYLAFDGTSFAAPFVSGVAARLIAANPKLTPGEVKELIVMKAKPFSWGGRLYGAGLVQLP
jgi:subtilisin family serine protease